MRPAVRRARAPALKGRGPAPADSRISAWMASRPQPCSRLRFLATYVLQARINPPVQFKSTPSSGSPGTRQRGTAPVDFSRLPIPQLGDFPADPASGKRNRAYLTRIARRGRPDRDCDRPAEHDRRHLVDASVSANTRRAYASVALPPRRVARRAPAETLRGFSRWVRRSRAPPSRSGLLVGRGRPGRRIWSWSYVSPPFDHPK